MNRLIEKHWVTEAGYEAAVLLVGIAMPHRCGYVRVPNDHKNYKDDYDDIDVTVHGGLTYADMNLLGGEDEKWFGFDAMHYMDGVAWDDGLKLIQTESERRGLEIGKEVDMFDRGTVKDLDYMIEQCESLAKQLKEMEVA